MKNNIRFTRIGGASYHTLDLQDGQRVILGMVDRSDIPCARINPTQSRIIRS